MCTSNIHSTRHFCNCSIDRCTNNEALVSLWPVKVNMGLATFISTVFSWSDNSSQHEIGHPHIHPHTHHMINFTLILSSRCPWWNQHPDPKIHKSIIKACFAIGDGLTMRLMTRRICDLSVKQKQKQAKHGYNYRDGTHFG